ncbi:MAG: hypothetical protein GY950_09380 [bacterium]|nr:hypothetical protein [bacterium]
MSNNLTQSAAMFWAGIVARAWEDSEFKGKLIANPAGTLSELGYSKFANAEGDTVQIVVKEDSNFAACTADGNKLTINLPKNPEALQNLRFEGVFGAGICC